MLIKGKKDILKNLRRLNIEYQKAKRSFIQASEFKGTKSDRKKKWEDAAAAYKHYLEKIYGKDIDALGEQGEIYSHLAQLTDNGEDEAHNYQQSIRKFEESLKYKKNNPFHKIRIAENYIRSKNTREALQRYLGLLRDDDEKKENVLTDKARITCMVNAGILAVRAEDEKALNEIIEKLNIHDPNNRVLSQLKDNRDRLKDGEEAGDTNEPIITKGTAKNLQWQTQWNGVLLLLLTFNGATKSQIKENWLDNLTTTELVLRTMLDVGRDKSTLSSVTRRGNFTSSEEEWLFNPIIEETTILGTTAYTLTKTGKIDAELVKKLVEKALNREEKIDLDPKFGFAITSKLVDRYVKWKNTLKSEE